MRYSPRLIVDYVRSEDDEEKAVYVISGLIHMAPCSDALTLYYNSQYTLVL